MKYPLLAIETTGQFASVALKDADGNMFSDGLTERLNHLKGLLPLIDNVLGEAGLDIKDVKTIAVSQGPGSFTGIRIGISTVRALAQITGAKVIGVPTLETFVYNDPMYRGIVCPVFDARMNQMYAGGFALKDEDIRILIKTGAYDSAEYCRQLTGLIKQQEEQRNMPLDFLFCGDGLEVFEQDIKRWGALMMEYHFAGFSYRFAEAGRFQVAASVLKWAENFGIESDYEKLLPEYIRKAEAQRRLDEKNACK